MKIAITGHTSGIGKAIYNDFPPSEVVGFSRENGYDITDVFHRDKIIKETQDCDVFINNAHKEYGQVYMLNELYQNWQYSKGKLIINIGTDAVPNTAWQVVHRMYPVEKAALHSAVEIIQQDIEGRRVKVTLLALGHVDTEFNKDYKGPKLKFTTIIDTVNWIIKQEEEIKSLVLSAKEHWK
jgi:NAD(P)-dependent dehydrogenase (short-subunit alcohol dehydrogenase family)